MTQYYKDQHLLQVVVEVDAELVHLSEHLNNTKYLEIGDDPSLVQEIENQLRRVLHQFKSLDMYFDLSVASLSKANYYYMAISYINDALKYMDEIKTHDFGSVQHTRQFLTKLNACIEGVRQISDLAEVTSAILH